MILTALKKKVSLYVSMLTKKIALWKGIRTGSKNQRSRKLLRALQAPNNYQGAGQPKRRKQLCPSSTVSTCQFACPWKRQLSWGGHLATDCHKIDLFK